MRVVYPGDALIPLAVVVERDLPQWWVEQHYKIKVGGTIIIMMLMMMMVR